MRWLFVSMVFGFIFLTAIIASAECKNIEISVTNDSMYPLRFVTVNALPAEVLIVTIVSIAPKSSASFEFNACDTWELTINILDQKKYQSIMSRSASYLVYVSDEIIAKEYKPYIYLSEDHPPDKADRDD